MKCHEGKRHFNFNPNVEDNVAMYSLHFANRRKSTTQHKTIDTNGWTCVQRLIHTSHIPVGHLIQLRINVYLNLNQHAEGILKSRTMATNEQPTEEQPPALPAIGAPEENPVERTKPVPNSKPRPATTYDDTYVYTDFAQASIESLDKATSHKKVPPPCLQAQKLPSKMAVMLVDPGEELIFFVSRWHASHKSFARWDLPTSRALTFSQPSLN